MYQGETITTTITGFPIPISEIKDLRIIFKNQSASILLEKTLTDCEVVDETVMFRLTQEESLSLKQGYIKRSVIIITQDGSRFESIPSTFFCEQTAKKEVL